MEQKNIIIAILVIIIIVLIAAIGAMMIPSLNAKKDSKIAVVSNETLYGGDNLTVKLTDLNNVAISGSVDVVITDNEGDIVVDDTLKTDSNGSASLKLDLDAGNYTVNATFSGNDNFTANTTIQNLEIQKETVEEQTSFEQSTQTSGSSSGSGIHYDSEINVYYNDDGVIVDPDGKHPQGVGSSYASARDAKERWDRGEPVMV